ncbi:NLP4 protein [Colletotrichum higginsianum IMI 349063]|uniref:NLP4 protein n=2 Tax=Colletotrichum higginsianum TaxID=80884 RepID=A0A1B7YAV8_COLHI|nr:NLP4 protein [Colletotrichum higginsianum IMI 349063]OBR09206.1 NLP4 protein [Colletotrichum higginsianum IMI 349063]TIC95036.1 hypothetical protein CH35J_008184 [Colletotrichum higginsianum]CCF70979.1 NLP4 protein [Colletotrichum higginsianum]
MIPSTVLSVWAALLAVTTASPIDKNARNTLLRRKAPAKMNVCAPERDLKWQPAMDFDMDSCYNTPAVDRDGNLNPGLSVCGTASTAGGCRDGPDLGNSNVYSRARCNNGWCAYLYGYYFEKDQVTVCLGHTHDWEHVVVFVEGGAPRYVSVSAHGRYTTRPWGDVLVEGTHVKVVYHKDGPGTHAFRFAKAEDDARQENHLGKWFYGDLVGWNGFPSTAVRDKMTGKSWGKAKIDFTDERFGDNLKSAIQAQGSTPYIIDMDADVDDASPGMPAHCPNHFRRVE